jgi:oxygen-independent coproporphyrinogen-3 oxidase
MEGVFGGKGIIEDRVLDPAERVFEFFLNQLRLRDGVLKDQLEPRAGVAWNEVATRVNGAIEKGLLRDENGVLSPTELGWRFSNEIQAVFLP